MSFSAEYKKWVSEVEQTAAPPLKHLTLPETELLHKAKKFAMECSVQAVSFTFKNMFALLSLLRAFSCFFG